MQKLQIPFQSTKIKPYFLNFWSDHCNGNFSFTPFSSVLYQFFRTEFGARPVKRVIQRDVLNTLSKEILSNTISKESIILLDAFDGQLVFRNQ